MPSLSKRERSIAKPLSEFSLAELQAELLKRWRKSPGATLGENYDAHETIRELAKSLYDLADLRLRKLVRIWKKSKRAPVDDAHYLEIEDAFRGQTKAFAPGFAHRYKLKLKTVNESE